jgi:hypothetical protein
LEGLKKSGSLFLVFVPWKELSKLNLNEVKMKPSPLCFRKNIGRENIELRGLGKFTIVHLVF